MRHESRTKGWRTPNVREASLRCKGLLNFSIDIFSMPPQLRAGLLPLSPTGMPALVDTRIVLPTPGYHSAGLHVQAPDWKAPLITPARTCFRHVFSTRLHLVYPFGLVALSTAYHRSPARSATVCSAFASDIVIVGGSCNTWRYQYQVLPTSPRPWICFVPRNAGRFEF